MSQASKLALIKEMLESAESNLRSAKQVINELTGYSTKNIYSQKAADLEPSSEDDGSKIVEGVFNGQTMSDQDKNSLFFFQCF